MQKFIWRFSTTFHSEDKSRNRVEEEKDSYENIRSRDKEDSGALVLLRKERMKILNHGVNHTEIMRPKN